MASGVRSRPPVQTLASYNPYIPAIAQLFTSLAKRGDVAQVLQSTGESVYTGGHVPQVPVEDYLNRWARYSFCSPEVFLVAVLYVDKLSMKTGLLISSLNVHRLLLTALVIAAKVRDDIYYSNKYYASIGGISLHEMNKLEASWLVDANWDVHVDVDQYRKYSREFDRQKSSTVVRRSPYRRCQPEPQFSDDFEPHANEVVKDDATAAAVALCCTPHLDRY